MEAGCSRGTGREQDHRPFWCCPLDPDERVRDGGMCFTSGPQVNLSRGGDQSMEPTICAKRVSTVRRFGWLGVASMLALALLAPAASVAAALVTPTYPAGNPTCTELDPAWTLSFKIDTGALENRASA